jgi:hypothetical protein
VAAYLFIIVIKILLNRIRRIVKGLNLGAGDLVVLAFADDLTIFVPNSEELAKAMCLIENFKAATGLQVNKEKSEILELGAKSTLIRVPVKLKVKITDMWFCLDKTSMSDTNWSAVQDRISVLLRSWRQRHITVMGRANIIKAQILPILSFIGTTIELPVSYEKAIVRDCFHFLWNAKTEKERRALCHKDFKDGGLAVPHFKFRLVAIKCGWIQRIKNHPGIFRHAFYKPHINWDINATFLTPFPKEDNDDFSSLCMNAWSDTLFLTKPERGGLIWPQLSVTHQTAVLKKNPNLTICKAVAGDITGFNFLKKAGLIAEARTIFIQFEKKWQSEGDRVRNNQFKDTACKKWRQHHTDRQEARLLATADSRSKNPIELNSQKQLYWLHVDQLVPPVQRFRSELSESGQ